LVSAAREADDAAAAPAGAPAAGAAVVAAPSLPVGSLKKRKKSVSGRSTRCVSLCCMLRS